MRQVHTAGEKLFRVLIDWEGDARRNPDARDVECAAREAARMDTDDRASAQEERGEPARRVLLGVE
jgi:hypothetical protein